MSANHLREVWAEGIVRAINVNPFSGLPIPPNNNAAKAAALDDHRLIYEIRESAEWSEDPILAAMAVELAERFERRL